MSRNSETSSLNSLATVGSTEFIPKGIHSKTRNEDKYKLNRNSLLPIYYNLKNNSNIVYRINEFSYLNSGKLFEIYV